MPATGGSPSMPVGERLDGVLDRRRSRRSRTRGPSTNEPTSMTGVGRHDERPEAEPCLRADLAGDRQAQRRQLEHERRLAAGHERVRGRGPPSAR